MVGVVDTEKIKLLKSDRKTNLGIGERLNMWNFLVCSCERTQHLLTVNDARFRVV